MSAVSPPYPSSVVLPATVPAGNKAAPPAQPPRRPWQYRVLRTLAGLAVLVAALVVLVAVFPWDILREPLNRFVSERAGRHFAITRQLDVKLGATTTIRADGIELANPVWARDPYLVRAESAEVQLRLWPLLRGEIALPFVGLHKPVIGLQQLADGRRTWAFGQDSGGDPGTVPKVSVLQVDEGVLHYVDAAQAASISTEFAIDEGGSATTLPLSYKARGSWKGQPFSAEGRTSGVLQLGAATQQPFALEINARAGATTLQGTATIGSLTTLDNTRAHFNVKGRSLSDLYRLLGVVLPTTPAYALRGDLEKQGAVWTVRGMNGRLGRSDLAGDLRFDQSQPVPLLAGTVRSRSLDFRDLAPLIGAQTAGAPATAGTGRPGKVLPDTPLAFGLLKQMQADVQFDAAAVHNVEAVPLERARARIRLQDGVLQLDPLDLGVAGGTVQGRLRIDSHAEPVQVATRLDARGLQLGRLFPTVELTKDALGRFTGQIDLAGQGQSVAQVLGTASGNMALLTGRGEISNMLLEFIGLDGGEIIKFFVSGDRKVQLRCAAAAFDVNKGLMATRSLVLDTSDTVVTGTGTINLASESLDVLLQPAPKDRSILSLRTPIRIGGTFAAPAPRPAGGTLALRAGAALALGAINPLLALAATYEPGPGEDANCVQELSRAGTPLKPGRRR